MKRVLLLIAMILLPVSCLGQTGVISGFSNLGGTKVTTQGASSTNYAQGIIPSALITVYLTGTQTLATIQTNSGGPLSNPFYSNASSATAPGGWLFRAATNQGLDVIGSSGLGVPNCTQGLPLCYPQPVALCVDCYPSASFTPVAGVAAVEGASPIDVNNQSGVLCNSGTCNVSCPTCTAGLALQAVPPVSGQNVVLYPNSVTVGGNYVCTGGQPAGSALASSASPFAGSVTRVNSSSTACPANIENQWNVTSLPPYVIASNVTAIYGGFVEQTTCSGYNSNNCGYFSATINGNATYPATSSWPLNTYTTLLCSGAACASFNYSAVQWIVENTSTTNWIGTGPFGGSGTFLPVLFVYYTGTAPPASTQVIVTPPLNYNQSILSLPLPLDAASDTGTSTAYAAYVPGYGFLTPGTQINLFPANTSTSTTPTFQLNSGSILTIVNQTGGALCVGDIHVGNEASLIFDASGYWRLQNPQVCGGAGVSSINSITGPVTLVAGSNVTVTPNTPAAGDIQISSSGGGSGGSSIFPSSFSLNVEGASGDIGLNTQGEVYISAAASGSGYTANATCTVSITGLTATTQPTLGAVVDNSGKVQWSLTYFGKTVTGTGSATVSGCGSGTGASATLTPYTSCGSNCGYYANPYAKIATTLPAMSGKVSTFTNYAVSGTTVAQALARFASNGYATVCAGTHEWFLLGAGIAYNSIVNSGLTAVQTYAQWVDLAHELRNAGCTVIASTIWQFGGTANNTATPAQQTQFLQFNQLIRTGIQGFGSLGAYADYDYCVDLGAVTQTNRDTVFWSQYLGGDSHPTSAGHEMLAQAMNADLYTGSCTSTTSPFSFYYPDNNWLANSASNYTGVVQNTNTSGYGTTDYWDAAGNRVLGVGVGNSGVASPFTSSALINVEDSAYPLYLAWNNNVEESFDTSGNVKITPSGSGNFYLPNIAAASGQHYAVQVDQNGIITNTGASPSGGSSVTVNSGSILGTANLNATTPAAPGGDVNCTWQASGSNVSCYVPSSGGTSTNVAPYATKSGSTFYDGMGYAAVQPGSLSWINSVTPTTVTQGTNGNWIITTNGTNTNYFTTASAAASVETALNYLCVTVNCGGGPYLYDSTNSHLWQLTLAYATSCGTSVLFQEWNYSGSGNPSFNTSSTWGCLETSYGVMPHLKVSVSGSTLTYSISLDGGQHFMAIGTQTGIGTISAGGVVYSDKGTITELNLMSMALN